MLFLFNNIGIMKKTLYLALLVAGFLGCKKEDNSNQVPGPNGSAPISYSYILSVINEWKTNNLDTIRIRINGVLLPVNMTNSVAYQHLGSAQIPKVKTGDEISIYYNPGIYVYNGDTVIDENNLKIYLDDELIQDSKCRCIVNVTKTVGKQ